MAARDPGSNPRAGRRRAAAGKSESFAPVALLALTIWTLAVSPVTATQSLTLTPNAGAPGSNFDAVYTSIPPARSGCPTGSAVAFWWDAAGPRATNPAGARLLGQALLGGSGCTARARLTVPATTSCAVHTVYAFIDDGRGGPVSGTVSNSRFTVAGCPTPVPSPRPTPRPTPKSTPKASASPTATAQPPTAPPPAAPSASVAATPEASAATSPTALPSPTPRRLERPAPSAGAPTPQPLGAAPRVPPEAPDDGLLLFLALFGALGLLGIWGGLYFLRFKPTGAGPVPKWGSLVLVLLLGGGGVGLAGQKGGNALNLTVPNWQFTTIQAALDAAPAGANVHIKPGVYHETLFVRKPLQIYGSEVNGGVVLEPPDLPDDGFASTEAVGLINYEGVGGGWLMHVQLHGGQAGLMGLGSANLEIDDLEVSGSRLGLVWDSAATLTANHISVHGTLAAGFVNLKGHHAFDEFGMTFAGGIGIYAANGTANFSDVDIEDNASAGIYIRKATVSIEGGVIANNVVAGIWAVDSSIDVNSVYIHSNHALAGRFGDGVTVLLGHAELNTVQSSYNDRCGVSAFGASIALTTTLYQDQSFHICGEGLEPSDLAPGLPAVDGDFSFDDLGGNYCYSGGLEEPCFIETPGLEPPEPEFPIE